jgi:outer membrane receptor protein involved in Fe transport
MKNLITTLSTLFLLGVATASMSTIAAAQTSAAQTAAPKKVAAASELEEVVVTGQKLQEGSIGGWIPVPLSELPRSVTIIDEEMISKQFVGHTKDILKNVAGVQIMPDNNLAGYQTPIIRGIQSSQYFEGQYSAGVITSMPDIIGGAEVLQGFNSLQFAIDTGVAAFSDPREAVLWLEGRVPRQLSHDVLP